MKFRYIIFLVLIAGAFGAGVYFRDDAIRFLNNLNSQIENFQKSDVGQTLTYVAKQIISPPPLNIGGPENQVVLLKSKIIEETNIQRRLNGLPAFKENSKLDAAAGAKADDMFKNQYFEHISPLGVGPGDLAQKYGYDYILEGENLILGNFDSEKEVVQDWMNSPGHRANILNNRYAEIGVAIVKGTYKGQTAWIGVQEFGLSMSACEQPDSALKGQIDLYKAQLDLFSLQIDQISAEIKNTNPRSAAYEQMINNYNQMIDQYNSLAEKIKQDIAIYNSQVNTFNACVAGK